MHRKHARLTLQLLPAGEPPTPPTEAQSGGQATAPGNDNEFPAVLVVGDRLYNGVVFVPLEELTRAAPTMERQPVNIDHSDRVEDEVGFVRDARMDGAALRGVLVLTPGTAKFAAAQTYILNRRAAGKPPEVSVGFTFDAEERGDGTVVARNIQFDHLALVTRGACSPADGCGIGLSKENPPMTDATPANAPATTAAPTPPADGTAAPTPPNPAPPPAPPATATAQPCACRELEKALIALKQENTQLKTDNAAKDARLKAYEDREFAALKAEAESLGVEVPKDVTLAALSDKVSTARQVAAKLAAAPAEPARHTTVAARDAGTDPGAQARAYLVRAGLIPADA